MKYKTNFKKAVRIHKLQTKNRMVGKTFCTLEQNQRRRTPWLGGSWFEPGKDEKRWRFIEEWKAETARMLKDNPALEIVG